MSAQKGRRLGMPDDFYEKIDIHVHIPEGATNLKSGPSAGITVATSIASATFKKVGKKEIWP